MNIKTVCERNMCTGCGACVEICKKGSISIVDNLDSMNAVINLDQCVDCGVCFKVCPNKNHVELRNQLSWHQGWTTKKSERKKSSSGGFATALSKAFVKNGGIVCSCTFLEGDFVFKAVSTEEEVECFRGSKYVKSNPKGIYRKVKKLLQEKNKVLFIGLPCQIAAVKNFVGEQNKDNLYTVDLICHGTPSVKILEKYMSQYGVSLSEIKDISFRTKNAFILKKMVNQLLDIIFKIDIRCHSYLP